MFVLSIDPILVRHGNFILTWHGLLMACGGLVMYISAVRVGAFQGFSRIILSKLAVWCVIGAFIGARLVWVFSNINSYRNAPLEVIYLNHGGMASSGGILGIILTTLYLARRNQLSFQNLMDVIVTSIPLGALIGRIGCLIQGDIHGVQNSQPWGLVYLHPATSIPIDLLGRPIFPVVPLMMLGMLGIWAVLSFLRRKNLNPGSLCAAFLMLYGLIRLLIGIWQEGNVVIAGMKAFQITGIFLFCGGLAWWLVSQRGAKPRSLLGLDDNLPIVLEE